MSEEREQRNQVFAQHAAAAGITPPVTSQTGQAQSDFGLEIPVETVPLPSGGKAYPIGTTLHGKETIDIRGMTTREEDILTNKVFLKKGTVITELIKSCLLDKSIDPTELLGGDRNTLMVAIRITGYGHEYDAELECANDECKQKLKHSFDLSQLPLKKLEIEPEMPGSNRFVFLLPYSKKKIVFKFLTGKDEEDIVTLTERLKKQGIQSENAVSTNLLYSIVSIDGNEDRAKIAQHVKFMLARDSRALRDYIRKNEPGLTLRQETACPACGHTEEVQMPFGVNFLWPSAST